MKKTQFVFYPLVVEKYTKTTRFCFICNYVSKIIPALQSRCTRFRFGPLDDVSVVQKLNEVAQSEELALEEGADKAIVSLSGGDMRKVLNILESCAMAYNKISVDTVFEVTGRPSPTEINMIYTWLTNEKYNDAFSKILQLKHQRSLTLDDIIKAIHQQVLVTNMSDQMKMFIIERLSQIEYRLAHGSNEKAQIASLVGGFVEIRCIKG